MGPKRSGGVAGRGRGRRDCGGCTPRSSCGGRRGATSAPSSSSVEEGFWRYDFLLRVLGRTATRIPLPFSFASIVSELNLGVCGSGFKDVFGLLLGWSWKLIVLA